MDIIDTVIRCYGVNTNGTKTIENSDFEEGGKVFSDALRFITKRNVGSNSIRVNGYASFFPFPIIGILE